MYFILRSNQQVFPQRNRNFELFCTKKIVQNRENRICNSKTPPNNFWRAFFCLNVKDAKGASSLLIILVTGAKQKLKVSFQKILKRKNQFNSRFSTAAHNRDKESQCLKIPKKMSHFCNSFPNKSPNCYSILCSKMRLFWLDFQPLCISCS